MCVPGPFACVFRVLFIYFRAAFFVFAFSGGRSRSLFYMFFRGPFLVGFILLFIRVFVLCVCVNFSDECVNMFFKSKISYVFNIEFSIQLRNRSDDDIRIDA